MRQILFLQGGGAGTHDDCDSRLVASLERELGGGFEVRYPRMPAEDEPGPDTWGAAIRSEVAALADGAVVVGHSLGGTLLVHALVDRPPVQRLGAVVLIGAPFVGAGGWPARELALPVDLGAQLPLDTPVHVVHGLDDRTVPPPHATLYARAIAQAQLHLLPGRDHQLGDDLSEVAALIARLPDPREPATPLCHGEGALRQDGGTVADCPACLTNAPALSPTAERL